MLTEPPNQMPRPIRPRLPDLLIATPKAMQQLKLALINLSGEVLPTVEAELRDFGATVDASFPDVDAALAHYRIPPAEKRVFLTAFGGPGDLPRLARLCDGFPGQPVLAIAPARDPETVIGAMRAGATQIVPVPVRGDDIRGALDRITRQFGLRPSAGRVIAVSGATEGCGATTVALNLARDAGRLGASHTLLVELGGHIGRLAVLLGVTPQYTTDNLLGEVGAIDPEGLRRAVTPVRDGLSLLAGGYKSITVGTPAPAAVLRLLGLVRRVADLVVLDVTCSFDELYFAVLRTVDDVVLVAEQKVPAVHSLMLVRDALAARDVRARQFYVINRYTEEMPGATLREIGGLMPGARLYPVRSDGRGVMQAINLGTTLREAAPDSPVLEDLGHLLEGIAGGPLGAPEQRPNWLRRGLHKIFHPA
jgi:pilus assembly protein CpaE